LIAVVVAFVVALSAITFASRPRTDAQRAAALVHSGHAGQGERIYARLAREHPTVPGVLSLIEAHEVARLQKLAKKHQDGSFTNPGGDSGLPSPDEPMSDEELELLLDALPPDISLVARFSRALVFHAVPPPIHDKVAEEASRQPPTPWMNHLLGQEAEQEGHHAEAAAFYEKEGISFYEHREDVDEALQLWIALDAWDIVRERLSQPAISEAASARVKYRLAIHDQDWRAAIRWLPAVWAPRLEGAGIAMSGITALAWAFFCARLGKARERPAFRLTVYAVAFVLGVASVLPTVFLIAIEEAKLKLVETGDPARDILFFIFGVGLREEASKLLLFLPLLPLLRRWGDKLDVLVCGAMVGLGFAAEENLNYLAQENLHTGLGRFLTANFFHMALTGTLASALDDFVADPEKNATSFSRTAALVVAIHGGYDFLLSHDEYGGSYLAMAAFVILTRMFLGAVDSARRRADRGITPLHAFVVAIGVVVGVTLAYGIVAVGPSAALLVVGSGLLGDAIVVYVFVRTLRQI
jgi:RsiW-degrading membrane proteinase PrsW (M82 family)